MPRDRSAPRRRCGPRPPGAPRPRGARSSSVFRSAVVITEVSTCGWVTRHPIQYGTSSPHRAIACLVRFVRSPGATMVYPSRVTVVLDFAPLPIPWTNYVSSSRCLRRLLSAGALTTWACALPMPRALLAPSPVVALPDTGVDDSHPELRGRVVFPAGHAELLADLHLRCGGLRGVVLVTKTLEDALRRVPLLRMAVAAIVLKPLLDQRGKLVELRSAHRRCASGSPAAPKTEASSSRSGVRPRSGARPRARSSRPGTPDGPCDTAPRYESPHPPRDRKGFTEWQSFTPPQRDRPAATVVYFCTALCRWNSFSIFENR